MCECTKGSDDLSYAYTNVAEGAAWRATMWSTVPWPVDETPAFLQLKGFDVKMLAIDMLHCWHLGIGRDLVGSAVKTLVRLRYWPGTSIEKSLGRATLCLRRWAKQHGLTLACRSLSKSSIGWDQDYPELRAKGYDCYVILKWLAEETSSNPPVGTNAVEQDYLDRISATIWCANSWLSSLSNAGMFLTEHQQELKTVIGAHYVSLYVGLAAQALAEKKKMWRVRPKLHLFHHRVIENRPSRLNPVATCTTTWMDEDFIKKTMKVKRMTHRRKATVNSLRRWLLAVPHKMAQALDKLEEVWKSCSKLFEIDFFLGINTKETEAFWTQTTNI